MLWYFQQLPICVDRSVFILLHFSIPPRDLKSKKACTTIKNGDCEMKPFNLIHTQMHIQVDDFLQALVNFDKEHIPEATVRCVREEHLSDPEFNPEFVRQKSSAAAGLCAWVINIIHFHEVNTYHT